ncbi:MAG: cell division protein FtsQ/DivIB [Sediminispirochaetaceae bacterium]
MSSIALFRDAGAGYSGLRGEKVSPRRKQKKKTQLDETKTKRVFIAIVLFLSFLLVLEILFHLVIAPRLVISNITIETAGDFPLSNEEILNIAGLAGGTSTYFSTNTKALEERLENIPMVRTAKVEKSFPRGLSLNLTKRTPIALLTVPLNGRLTTAFLDENGVIYSIGEVGNADFPVISGVEIPRVEEGMKLPQVLHSFLEDLEELKGESPSLYRLISEVKFVKNNSTEYDVILYPSHYRVRVRIGPSIDKKLLTYVMLVLDVLSGRGMEDEVVEVDFRTDNVVYRVEGD